MPDRSDGPIENSWDYDSPDPALVHGDRPTDTSADRPTHREEPAGDAAPVPKLGGAQRVAKRRAYAIWASVLVIAVIGAVAVAVSAGGSDEDAAGDEAASETLAQAVEIPDVVGLDREVATSELETAGFEVVATIEVDESARPDQVLRQDPRPGEEAPAGSVVALVVAEPPPLIPVPDVVGTTESDAVVLLLDAGLAEVTVERVEADSDAGIVVGQEPGAGEQVEPTTKVVLEVSSGSTSVRVPNVVGLAEADAVRVLEGIGWTVQVDRRHDDVVAAGLVITSDPAARVEVAVEATVTLTVSSGPPVVVVPDVVGENVLEASAALQQLGLSVATAVCETGDQDPATVVSQKPRAGREVEPGREVRLCVAVAPPTPTPVPPTPIPPPRSQNPPGGGGGDGGSTPTPDPGDCALPSDPRCS